MREAAQVAVVLESADGLVHNASTRCDAMRRAISAGNRRTEGGIASTV
jgi:hypothetical protein